METEAIVNFLKVHGWKHDEMSNIFTKGDLQVFVDVEAGEWAASPAVYETWDTYGTTLGELRTWLGE